MGDGSLETSSKSCLQSSLCSTAMAAFTQQGSWQYWRGWGKKGGENREIKTDTRPPRKQIVHTQLQNVCIISLDLLSFCGFYSLLIFVKGIKVYWLFILVKELQTVNKYMNHFIKNQRAINKNVEMLCFFSHIKKVSTKKKNTK